MTRVIVLSAIRNYPQPLARPRWAIKIAAAVSNKQVTVQVTQIEDSVSMTHHANLIPQGQIPQGQIPQGQIPQGEDIADKPPCGSARHQDDSALSDLLFRALAHTGCGVLIANNQGTITYSNPRVTEITGFTAEELYGKNPRIFKSGTTTRQTYLEMWNTISSGKTWKGELQNRRKNGELFWESITVSPVTDERKSITHFVAVIEDITKAKDNESSRLELELELRQSKKRESLGTVAMGIAHDFNNLLTSILGNTSLLISETEANSTSSRRLREIIKATEIAAGLVRKFLSYTGKQLTEKQVVDLSAIIAKTRAEYKEHLPPETALICDYSSASCVISADETQIEQALENLIINAAESLDGQSPAVISLQVYCSDKQKITSSAREVIDFGILSGPCAVIEVKDSGCGMTAEVLDKAFDPFYSTKFPGRGLGLAVVSGVMRSHGGAIAVCSEPNCGTKIQLLFPLDQ